MAGFVPMLLAAVVAQSSPAQAAHDDDQREIIVIGQRIGDARRRLQECIARGCPPGEDIAATLGYAEALFIDGNYREARSVLRASIRRNRGAADRHPIGVSGLFRASARMAMHEGDSHDVQQSTYNVERSLRAGLPQTDPRLITARIETAEMHAALERHHLAERNFREAAAAARDIRRPDLAALADLRRAMLAHRLRRSNARDQLEAIASLTDRETRVQQLAARIVLAGMDRDSGDAGAMDRLISQIAAAGVERPVLLYSPPIQVTNAASTAGYAQSGSGPGASDPVPVRNMSTSLSSESFDYWADIGFWINAEGRVEDTQVLRSHGPQHWLRSVLTSIPARIYSRTTSGEPQFRVERYRYTSLLERRSDTRIAGHSAQGRIEMIDITNSASASPRSAP